MATKTITAMFNTRDDAERAAAALVAQLGLDKASIRTSPDAGVSDTGYDAAAPYAETGFFASLKDMFMPEEDRYTYAEGMRRGAVLLTTSVEESRIEAASDVLEHAGAVDLDAQEASWRQSGWTGYDAAAHAAVPVAAMPAAATAVRPGLEDETIKVVQERLVVGKRAVESGRVKVRAYVVERPVEETVTLHEESVHVTRHAVDRAATAADLAVFGERTIEARAMSEEVVVGKEARVVEEIAVHKDAVDRSQTIHDTVRETKVDVDDAVVPATADVHVATTHPDGTPGNPPGTMASRAVDKTLGTNISGANPTGKI